MKYLLIIISAIFLISCGQLDQDGTTTPTGTAPPVDIVPPDDDPDEPDDDDDEPIESFGVIPKFALYTGEDFYFSDEKQMKLWKTGTVKKSGVRKFIVAESGSQLTDLITLDQAAKTIETESLSLNTVKIRIIGDDKFHCVEYPPELSYSLGALYRTYSEIYKNDEIMGIWYLNDFECREIVTASDNVFIANQHGTHELIEGDAEDVLHVSDSNFIIHSDDKAYRHIWVNSTQESYKKDYILTSKQWIEYNGVFYSEKGHTWSETDGLTEAANDLDSFGELPYPVTPELPYAQRPTLLKLGVYSEKLYWVECNSGFVFEFDPGTGGIEQKFKIYDGDGSSHSGGLKRHSLKPLIVDNMLYFSNDVAVYSLNLDDGIINIFYSMNAEVVKYD